MRQIILLCAALWYLGSTMIGDKLIDRAWVFSDVFDSVKDCKHVEAAANNALSSSWHSQPKDGVYQLREYKCYPPGVTPK